MVEIVLAKESDAQIVKAITHEDIKTIYPKYYPAGAVQLFINHHNDEHILKDIKAGIVYLLKVDDVTAGTITMKENEIDRLYILPEYHHKGYGKMLLDFAEEQILSQYPIVKMDTSLPAKEIYIKRGYKLTEYHVVDTGYGDYLCYDVMEKGRNQ